MRIKYSPDADVLIIQLREGKASDSRDIVAEIRPFSPSHEL